MNVNVYIHIHTHMHTENFPLFLSPLSHTPMWHSLSRSRDSKSACHVSNTSTSHVSHV